MKITFLGTSHGYAEKGRFTSATLIESGGHSYLLDAGGPVEALMVNLGKSYSDIRGIFITHMHSDHVGSLNTVIEPFMSYRRNDDSVCFLPEQNGLDAFIQWLTAIHVDREKLLKTVEFRVTQPGMIFKNDDITVTAIPTKHLEFVNSPSYAYRFEHNGKRVLFTGDMSTGFGEYPDISGGVSYDLIVCEMAHCKLENAAEMLKKSNTKRMIINHYHVPQLAGYEEISKTFPFDISLAYDGLEVTV